MLRIEDTDQDRSSLESVRAILDAMKWLGLDWDEGPEVGGPHEPYFQSERKQRYREVADLLISRGKAYRCYCTKEELDLQREALKASDPKAQFVYPGTCRARTAQPDLPFVVRFMSPRDGVTTFSDLVFGVIATPNSQQQDFVLLRQNGLPLYNLGAAVDYHDMDITLVARGRDHIGNTPQQVLIYQALDWEVPQLAHLPMMLSPKGEKLSKRHAAVSVSEYKDKGYTPEAVLNYLVRFGWSSGDREIFSREELVEAFNWESVGRSDGKFDEKKFADVAFEHLKEQRLTSDERYLTLVAPYLEANDLPTPDPTKLALALPLIRERARDLKDAAHHLDFYFREPPVLEEKARAKFLTSAAAPLLDDVAAALQKETEWTATRLEGAIAAFIDARAMEMKVVAQPLRVALTGRTASPGLYEVMVVLGRERTLLRLAAASVTARQAG